MSKRSRYVCQACGAVSGKWSGKCDDCGAWNTIVEEVVPEAAPKSTSAAQGRALKTEALSGAVTQLRRLEAGIREFDVVTGGGLVPGSATLVGGEPGIGKSTLLLQVAGALARKGLPTTYVTGEEAADQVRHRAQRLGLGDAPVRLVAATNVSDILATVESGQPPAMMVIDSIQTMFVDGLDSAPGSVAQVRGSAQALVAQAKRSGAAMVLLGHVTKEGVIAGPRVLEHMVDTVLTFEGERGHTFRILRATKNRFGPADEIGVFTMTAAGLREEPNPSALFLSDHAADTSGTAVFAGVEGTRPVLVEIQALVAPSPLATPRRAVVGWDSARLAMVLAVLEARCGVAMAGRDVYLNVTGGLRISEPGADLAAAAALVSSLTGEPVPAGTVFFGEIGLSGDVRNVAHAALRLKEAAKLGFKSAWVPQARGETDDAGLDVVAIRHLSDLVTRIGGLDADTPVPLRERKVRG
ncbi:MAG: DNA repair protein RadA [Alphaproteobacteria bacterium]|nr:DNA repair protein RadA [Alphaproteobacteria bacterium]